MSVEAWSNNNSVVVEGTHKSAADEEVEVTVVDLESDDDYGSEDEYQYDGLGRLIKRTTRHSLRNKNKEVFGPFQGYVAPAIDQPLIIQRGKTAQKIRAVRTFFHVAYQLVFTTLFTFILLNISNVVKFFIPFASVVMEAVMLTASVINMIRREKPWYLLTAVVLASLTAIIVMGFVDAYRFGIATPAVMTMFGGAPIAFTVIGSVFSFCWLLKFGFRLYYFIKDPTERVPLKAFSLVNIFVKASCAAVVAGLTIPFFTALVANPYGALVFLGAIAATVAVVGIMKIVKTIIENVVWRKTITDFLERDKPIDPYGLLNVNILELNRRLAADNAQEKTALMRLKNFGQKLKHIYYDSPLSKLFMSAQDRQAAQEDMQTIKDARASSYIHKCYKDKYEALEAEYKKPDTSYEKKIDILDEQRMMKLAFELVRKTRGAKLWEEKKTEWETKQAMKSNALPRIEAELQKGGSGKSANPYAMDALMWGLPRGRAALAAARRNDQILVRAQQTSAQ